MFFLFQSSKKLILPNKSESVKVVVRCRPMNEKETKDGHERFVSVIYHIT